MRYDDASTTVLYRPVGRDELALIAAAGYRAFPPRKAEQPIFYPVLHESYATQIARDWNPGDEASGYAGYVTRFRVRSEFLERYEVHTVGSSQHEEYWIPAAELEAFNAALVGPIEVVASYEGEPPQWEWRTLNRAVGHVLLTVWDPLGMRNQEEGRNEYDGYAPEITRLILRGADDRAVIAALRALECDRMGLSPAPAEHLAKVVTALRTAAAAVARAVT